MKMIISSFIEDELQNLSDVSIDKINKVTGMNITIVIDSNTDKESYELLKAFGMPFISKN